MDSTNSEETQALELAISQYEIQLSQVQAAMSCASSEEERLGLSSLCSDIGELIRLTRENLLSVKKQQLLAALPPEPDDPLDQEYLLFKVGVAGGVATMEKFLDSNLRALKERSAELGDEPTVPAKPEEPAPDIGADLQALAGMKCQAPYKQQYGGDVSYHNAMVSSVDSDSTEGATETSHIQVRVIFVNPTHQAMRLCPYYLDGKCRFDDDKCRFSHGELVPLSDLREYKEPDFSAVRKGSRVLARGTGDLWHCASVQAVENSGGDLENQQDLCHVRFEASGEEAIIEMQSVLPLDDESSSESDTSDEEFAAREEEEEALVIANNILMSKGPATALGAWEQHTRGIGSKLMAKMGYITGSGLGKDSAGKVEPVEAYVLPPGKSLDHCMRLKETTGDQNLFKAERRQRRQRMKLQKRHKKQYEREKKKTSGTVFDFINSYLTPVANEPSTSRLPTVNGSKPTKEVGNLKEDSRRGLNVRGLKLEEDIRRTEREVASINQSLARHANSNTPTSKALQAKLSAKQGELATLRREEQSVNSEKNMRQDRLKMVHF